MIQKLLIANRGEIAVRIIRACREMGIETVAVYSKADKDALHTQLADEAICIGETKASESYLNMESIISATIATGADAIHPGFGFLSENSKFARLCEQCNIIFIGPKSDVMYNLGNKSVARKTMIEANVPVIPGSEEQIYDSKTGKKIADQVGYPVIIKAALGGGGKGMRVAENEAGFDMAFRTAQKETKAAFGDDTMYIEHFVQHPKHIEFQIMADKYGNVVHLGERDCSVQRNHQKMIEESPCAVISDELRRRMGEAAVKAAKAAHYENAGTIEFLLEKSGKFYFMEMNTRIQVEHPVTECLPGDGYENDVDSWSCEPGSFLRLRNIGLKYDFSSRMLSAAHIKSLSLGFNVENAFLITNYSGSDPEVTSYDAVFVVLKPL